MSEEQSTILTRPEDYEVLKSELETERTLVFDYLNLGRRAPELRGMVVAWYQYHILQKLVERGSVDSFAVSRELAEVIPYGFRADKFDKAFDNVRALIEEGKIVRS